MTKPDPIEWGPVEKHPDRIDITASRNFYWRSNHIGRVEQRTDRWDAIIFADRRRIVICTSEAPNPEGAMYELERFINDMHGILR